MIKTKRSILLITALLSLSLTACGSGKEAAMSTETMALAPMEGAIYSDNASYSEVDTADYKDSSADTDLSSEVNTSDRKMIKNVYMEVKTTDYNGFSEMLLGQIGALGGYISDTSMWTDSDGLVNSSLTIRIPADHCDELITLVENGSNMVSKNESVEDVTLRYSDLDSHKKALLTEQDTLLKLMSQAETVSDIIEIEKRLSEVRYEIESMESQLRLLQNQISYSTINLTVTEVSSQVATGNESTLEMIGRRFYNNCVNVLLFLKGTLIDLIVGIPFIITIVLFIAIILIIIKTIRKLKKKFFNKHEPLAKETSSKQPDSSQQK